MWSGDGRVSFCWASHGRKNRLNSSPPTCRTFALPSMSSGGVPLTPWIRNSTQGRSSRSTDGRCGSAITIPSLAYGLERSLAAFSARR